MGRDSNSNARREGRPSSGGPSLPARPKPARGEIAAAHGRSIPDVLAPGLTVLFCGINPSLYSGATGHHFARPGNRFWRTLHLAGFTDRLLSPFEDGELRSFGLGVTNLVNRATATAAELQPPELRAGALRLRAKVLAARPRILAVVGVSAYRTAFDRPAAVVGRQGERIGTTEIWALPNPSGLNAHYQIDDLAAVYGELRMALRGRTV
ncbi:MAG: G/U mismatch-specific DNA glycosylase [Actinomycetota bacterium]